MIAKGVNTPILTKTYLVVNESGTTRTAMRGIHICKAVPTGFKSSLDIMVRYTKNKAEMSTI